MTKTNSPRPLDHVVLPTGDLTLARDRLTALGFSVSPQGTHPFGTINCCVYLGDGTFLEPLAVADLAATKALLVERAVAHDLDGQRLVVPAAPGQGATYIFEEQK